MTAQEIFEKLKSIYSDDILEIKSEPPSDPFITVKAEKIFDIGLTLRDDEDFLFDYLKCLSGMDLGENFGVVYHLYSMKFSHHIVLKVLVPKENPVVPSVERVWRTADWHEREAFDLVGIDFIGHHNLIRILNPYDWEGHPLQKNYQTPEYYHGMKVPY
jgi:NADH-quinone oxidoreductase subunit C